MTLATRCSACGTSFRVVQDQLKVSGGWVRCGRCGEVFNAIEGLYEVGSPIAEPPPTVSRPAVVSSPSPTPTPTPTPETSVGVEAPVREVVEAPPSAPTETAAGAHETTASEAPAPISELPAWPDEVGAPAPSPEVGADQPATGVEAAPAMADSVAPAATEGAVAPAEFEFESAPDSAPTPPPEIEPEAAADAGPEQELPAAPKRDTPQDAAPVAGDWRTPGWGASEPVPSFLRKADRAARWQRPHVRRVLGAAALLLTGTLGLQAAIAYRDVLASRWPAAKAPLLQACSWLGCRIEPPRYIAAMSVEASGLQQLGSTAVYQLSIVLRNRSDIAVMAPALELVLSDAQGATVARKVLSLAEFGRADRAIGAGSEWSGQAVLDVGGRRVSGYTIEIFYP